MYAILALVIAVLAAIFAVQNGSPATVTFLAWNFQQSLGVVLLTGFTAGFAASLLIYLPARLRLRWQLRRRDKRVAELEGEIAALRQQVTGTGGGQAAAEDLKGGGEAPTWQGGSHGRD